MAINIPIISSLDAKGFEKATREFKSLATNSERSAFVIKKAFLPAVATLGVLATAGVKAANMASDLNEETSKTRVVFGEASDSVLEFSKNAAKSLGQSQTQALKAAGTFGVLGQAAGLTGTDLTDMAVKFTTLASDLASFNNTTPEDAILALGAGLRGEAEPLRRYGILLNDATLRQKALELGLIQTTKNALTPQQKSLAAQAVIFEKSIIQQGDFARTASGAANQQRILNAQIDDAKTKIGQGFLPVMEVAVSLLAKFAGFAKDNAPLIVALSLAVGAFTTAIIAARGAMFAWKAISVITTGINYALSLSFSAVQVATGIGIATALAGAAAFVVIKNKMDAARGAAIAYGNALPTVIENQEQLNKFVGPVASRDFKTFKGVTDDYNTSLDKMAAKQEKAKAAAQKLKDELKAAKNVLADQFAEALKKANGVLDEAVGRFDDYKKSVSDAVIGGFSFANAQKDTEESAETFLQSLRKQATKVKNFGVLLNRLIAAGLNEQALSQVLAAGTEAGTLIAEELLNTAGGVLEANTLTNDVKSIADQVGANSAAKFYQAGVDAGTNLVRGIQAVVDNYTIQLNAATTIRQVQNLTAGFGADSGAVFAGGGAPASDLGGFSGFDFSQLLAGISVGGLGTLMADGGIVTRATTITAGEAGPEAIIPLSQAGRFGLDGGGTTVNINVNGGDPNAVVAALRTYMRQNGSVPIRVSNIF